MRARVETTFVVPSLALVANGTTLYDTATDDLNLTAGQLGVFTNTSPDTTGNLTAVSGANVTSTNQDWIQFIQRRDETQDTTPLNQLIKTESPQIYATCFLRAKGTAAEVKSNSSWVIGAAATSVNAVPVASRTEYRVQSGLRGWHVDLYNGNNTPYNQGRYTTPDFAASTIYTTDAQRRDLILHEIAANYNETSNGETVALVFDSAATVGAPTVPPTANPNNVRTLTQLAALTAGSKIIIGYTDEGQPVTLTVDTDLKQTFANMIAGTVAAGTWQLIPYARSVAANTSVTNRIIGGGVVAGTAMSQATHIVFVSLDQKQPTYNEVFQSKARIQVGVDGGFTGTASQSLTTSSAGAGYAKDVLNYFRNTTGHNQYIGGKDWQDHHVEYPNFVQSGAIYDTFVIDHCIQGEDIIGGPSQPTHRTVICVQNLETTGFTGFTGVANVYKAEIQTAINNWMNSTRFPHTNIAL